MDMHNSSERMITLTRFTLLDFTIFIAFLVVLLAFVRNKQKNSRLPLPPGPPKLPFIGNILSFPSSFEWEMFHQWSKKYSK